MKKILLSIHLILITSSAMLLPNGTDTALEVIKNDIKGIEQEQNQNGIQEINSPAIKQEKAQLAQQQIATLLQHAKELDALIAQTPSRQQMWQEKQSALLAPSKGALKKAIQQNINYTWQKSGGAILNLAAQATLSGITTAAIMFSNQAMQMGTGNLDSLNSNALIIGFLSSASVNLIAASSKAIGGGSVTQTALSSLGGNVLTQTLFTPSVESKSYQLKMPTFTGAIQGWIIGEAIATVNTMLEQNGAIAQAVKNINVQQMAFGQALTPMSNNLVATALPKIQNVIGNRNLAVALTEIGWISFQSAAIGGLLYAAGLGYTGTSMTESINYSVLLGMAQGTLANLAAIVNATTPGALLNVTSVPLAQQIANLTGTSIGSTPQTALTGVLQATVTEVTNFIINESQNSGGVWGMLQKGKNALGSAISSRWSSVWGTISETFATIQEIDPL